MNRVSYNQQDEDEGYLPYHRKYRPKSFAQYRGNESMKRALMQSLNVVHRPQVLFFSGPAGSGKTSMARLVIQEYMCENRDPVRGACGDCYYCQKLQQYIETGKGDYLEGIREVDAAADGGKADIDSLLTEASIPSFDGTWKIFMIDECHELTLGAQNRLLKTLEEPSPNVLIILCTTDPHKMIEPVLTRCQLKFEVTKPKRNELVPLLEHVCKEEGVKYDKRALSLVCVKGQFVPRTSLILLESVVTQAKSVLYQQTIEVLEIVSETFYFDFYRYVTADHVDPVRFISFLGRLKQDTRLSDFVNGLLEFTQRGIYVINGATVEALDESEVKQYKKLFSTFDVRTIALILNRIIKLKYSKDIEADMMLMGYTGLLVSADPVAPVSSAVPLLSDTNNASDVAQERMEGRENHALSRTVTEEEKASFIETQTAPTSLTDLGALFGMDVIKTTNE